MQAEMAEGVDKMDEDGPTEENKAAGAITASEEEETQKGRDQATETEVVAKRMRHLSASGGRGNREDIQYDEEGGSDNEVANSTWAKSSLPAEKNQRKKEQTTLPSTKPKHKCVLFIEVKASGMQ